MIERMIYDYKANEEIKNILIGIQDLHCLKRIDNLHYMDHDRKYKEAHIDHIKHVVKQELLQYIEKFIQIKQSDDSPYIEGVLYLPYVKDDIVENLESEVKSKIEIIDGQARIVGKLKEEIRLLSRPWWKKLFNIDSKQGSEF